MFVCMYFENCGCTTPVEYSENGFGSKGQFLPSLSDVLKQVQRTRLMEGRAPLENLPDVEEPASGVRAASAVRSLIRLCSLPTSLLPSYPPSVRDEVRGV